MSIFNKDVWAVQYQIAIGEQQFDKVDTLYLFEHREEAYAYKNVLISKEINKWLKKGYKLEEYYCRDWQNHYFVTRLEMAGDDEIKIAACEFEREQELDNFSPNIIKVAL